MVSALLICLVCAVSTVYGQLFQGCDYVAELGAGQSTTIQSNNYPSNYQTGSSCRYQITAPSFYKITATCSVYVAYSGSSCGSNDLFRYIIDGTTDITSNRAGSLCGYYSSQTFTSEFNSVTFGHTSSSFNGYYTCQITTTAEPSCDCGWSVNTRILGGTQPSANALASVAGLFSIQTQSVYCGASLVSLNCAITAAHCVAATPHNSASDTILLVGRRNVQVSSASDTIYSYSYSVQQILRHQNYVSGQNNYDLALIFTNRKIAWNRGVAPICLPNPSDSSTRYDNSYVTIAGWGTTTYGGPQSSNLLAASVLVYPLQNCQQDLPSDTLYSSQICTTGQGQRDACQYDSGGPVMNYDSSTQRYFCIGLISYGPACGVNKPAVNTRVSSYVAWIKYYAGSQSFCQR